MLQGAPSAANSDGAAVLLFLDLLDGNAEDGAPGTSRKEHRK